MSGHHQAVNDPHAAQPLPIRAFTGCLPALHRSLRPPSSDRTGSAFRRRAATGLAAFRAATFESFRFAAIHTSSRAERTTSRVVPSIVTRYTPYGAFATDSRRIEDAARFSVDSTGAFGQYHDHEIGPDTEISIDRTR